MQITGSVLRHFSSITLGTADEKHYTMRMTPLTSAAIALIGIPHLGFRGRARIVLNFFKGTPKSARILDAGCGYGIYTLTLAERGYTIDAMDLLQERIDAIDSNQQEWPLIQNRIHLKTGSLTELPYANEEYDTIICSDVIEHIADDTKAVSELSRVLKPNGTLILTVPYHSKNNSRIYKQFGHERPGYTTEEMQTLIAPYSLTIEKVACYEYALGDLLFKIHNKVHAKSIMAALFYPFYIVYLFDGWLRMGEPNGIGFKIRKIDTSK